MAGASATARIETALGVIALTADDHVLTAVRILPNQRGEALANGHPLLADAIDQMRAWFAGTLTRFALPLAPAETAEAIALRAAIAAIPYGSTQTYGQVAQAHGSIARAVGQACKANPFPIIIPCHRVTSASGPEYYSGGDGARTKGWLIDFEHAHLSHDQRTRLL